MRAKRATFTFWVDKSSLKMPKNGQFWRLFENLELASKQCYQKNQIRHFKEFSNNVVPKSALRNSWDLYWKNEFDSSLEIHDLCSRMRYDICKCSEKNWEFSEVQKIGKPLHSKLRLPLTQFCFLVIAWPNLDGFQLLWQFDNNHEIIIDPLESSEACFQTFTYWKKCPNFLINHLSRIEDNPEQNSKN